LDRRLGEPQSRYGRCGVEINGGEKLGNSEIKAVSVYLQSDVGSNEKGDGYKQYEPSLISTQWVLMAVPSIEYTKEEQRPEM
jgi:hypothetical protein